VRFCQVGAQFASKTWMAAGNQTGQLTTERYAMHIDMKESTYNTLKDLGQQIQHWASWALDVFILYSILHFITKFW
jgi:hypothetical protein